MKAISEPIRQYIEIKEIEEQIKNRKKTIHVYGNESTARACLMQELSSDSKMRLVVTYDEQRVNEIYEDLRFYDKNVYIYPSKDILFYSADIHGNTLARRRMEVLKRLISGEACTVVLQVSALLDRMPELSYLKKHIFTIETAGYLDVNQLAEVLVELGYEKNDSVDGVGQFAIRGGIIDIFPLTEECPYRIELWDTEVDTIRSFDVESQRSIQNVDSLTIYPATEMVLSQNRIERGLKKIRTELKEYAGKLKAEFHTEEYARINREIDSLSEQLREFNAAVGVDSFVEYFYGKTTSLVEAFPEDTTILLDEPNKISNAAFSCLQEFNDSMESRLRGGYVLPGQTKLLFDYEEVAKAFLNYKTFIFSLFPSEDRYVPADYMVEVASKGVNSYHNSFENLISDIEKWRGKSYKIILVSPSATRGKRLAENLMRNDINCFFSENKQRELQPGEMMITSGRLRAGFDFPEMKLVVVSEGDIFSSRTKGKGKKKTRYAGEVIKSYADISVGDYVVHEKYGIGIYRGIEKVEVDNVLKDYITVEYAGGGKLYVLASEVEAIQKYSSIESRKPKISRLGGSEWERTRNKVKNHVATVAKDLVELYAKRSALKGYCFSRDSQWQREFEEMFPYQETTDQINAIAETKKDMESDKIMDRLICGDVGFGKTEVAIRAAFKAAGDSKQVAYLVPTTILAQQHYDNFVSRMKDFPVNVRMLSRFCTAKEIKETISDLKEGKVDIVIGTHRLLSKDVEFKNLGLLIIDEEQRFGVTHKEKIKKLKTNVDVLTLTATPIPRTLHMSLIGIRDMSLLEEPPVDRHAIQTYVMEYEPELVREAIKREMTRKGQIYYVYNRVQSIDKMTEDIQQLVPEARVEYAHGQMGERQLEDIMHRFINKEIDVLVSTTIIETGLDIPNVNTMIIHDADKFGLSQLYQLRGRVGRSDRAAYAFLLYRRDKLIKETAEKRLKAIREFTDLGSGYMISMKDLEIRGAGNILGSDQSGHMEEVGYDLYCKMLNDAIRKARGEQIEDGFETTVQLPFDAYIPAEYVQNEFVKLDLYKRISQMSGEEIYEDILDEMTDRFGEPPKEVMNLMDISLIKARANKLYITSIVLNNNELRIGMYQNASIDTGRIDEMMTHYNGRMRFVIGKNPMFILRQRLLTEKEIWERVDQILEDLDGLIIRVDITMDGGTV
jgi:transcription-repair coupling factor (superfamily II helicase)